MRRRSSFSEEETKPEHFTEGTDAGNEDPDRHDTIPAPVVKSEMIALYKAVENDFDACNSRLNAQLARLREDFESKELKHKMVSAGIALALCFAFALTWYRMSHEAVQLRLEIHQTRPVRSRVPHK